MLFDLMSVNLDKKQKGNVYSVWKGFIILKFEEN